MASYRVTKIIEAVQIDYSKKGVPYPNWARDLMSDLRVCGYATGFLQIRIKDDFVFLPDKFFVIKEKYGVSLMHPTEFLNCHEEI